ncbi:hypothetical protein [Streptomyces sp. NPDC049585]|uniref:VG15 protein n=1 Tax=Streptomyces sp. NPDC049585 TaxID=3155154 RepID=UPI003444D208
MQARQATAAYRRAQERIAAEVAADLTAWLAGVCAEDVRAGAGALGREYRARIARGRRRSYGLAVAFYRLLRALETGTVVNLPGAETAEGPTLAGLWAEFGKVAGHHAGSASLGGHLPVDDTPWAGYDERTEQRRAEGAFHREVTARLDKARGAAERRGRLDDPEFEKELAEVMTTARQEAARTGSQVAEDGGREALAEAIRSDPKALGYYRETDADPCAWCAMLGGRGAVYKSAQSAGLSDGHRYHPDCHCQPRPVFSRTHTLPEANQRYMRLWREKSADGLTLAEWRRELEKESSTT